MLTRRAVIRSSMAGALVAAAVVPGVRLAAQSTVPRRRSLGEMDLDDPDLETYREFVTLMKDPSRDGEPVSWVSFADVHGSLAGGFNLCPHGNWYFTPWHRGYLRMYEAAIRDMTGNQEFALPYWDWTIDRQMPRAFSDQEFDGQPNPLFIAGRALGPNDSLPDHIVGQQQVMDGVYAESNFEAFGSTRATGQDSLDPSWIQQRGVSGTLEATPHDNIHCIIRGPFMCSGASPQDPIFLMHHCNIDRIWAVWNSMGRTNTTDPLWLDMAFTDHFIAPDGATYTDTVRDLQEVASLGYTYGLEEDEPYPYDPGRSLYFTSLFSAPELLERTGFAPESASPTATAAPTRPLTVPISPNTAALRSLMSPSRRAESDRSREPQVYAILRGLDPTESETTQLRVFVNCDYLSQATPTTDPHYVTTIGFFGAEAHEAHKPSALVNLTPALRRLARGQRLETDEVRVQLLPAPQFGRDLEAAGTVRVGEVELVII